jgi:hypothetical protein
MFSLDNHGVREDKIIAVHVDDPVYREYTDINQLPSHRMAEIRSFFEDFQLNEDKVGGPRWPVQGRGKAPGGLVRMCRGPQQRAAPAAAPPRTAPTSLRSPPAHSPLPACPPQIVRVEEILGAEAGKELVEFAVNKYIDNFVSKKWRDTYIKNRPGAETPTSQAAAGPVRAWADTHPAAHDPAPAPLSGLAAHCARALPCSPSPPRSGAPSLSAAAAAAAGCGL